MAAPTAASKRCVAGRSGVEVITAIGVLTGPRVGVTLGVRVAEGVAEGTAV